MNGKEGEGKLKAISEDLGGVVRSFFFFLEHKVLTLLPFSLSVFKAVTWKGNREVQRYSSWRVSVFRGLSTALVMALGPYSHHLRRWDNNTQQKLTVKDQSILIVP